MKKKILFIHHGQGIGGASISLINTILALDKEKYKASVLLLKESNVVKLLNQHNIDYTIAKSFFYRRIYRYLVHSEASVVPLYRADILFTQILSWVFSKYVFAASELTKLEYDLVHLNSSVLTDWLAPCKKKSAVIMHVREPIAKGVLGLRFRIIQNEISKYADKVIAISSDNAQRLDLKHMTEIVYNFINRNKFVQHEQVQSGKILYLGGDDFIKGYLNVVNSLDYLDSSIKVLFCGNYSLLPIANKYSINIFSFFKQLLPSQRKLRSAVKKMRNHPNAIFIGLVSDVSDLLYESEFLISPFDKPHFSRPIFEAFANQRCVIGSNVEGMEEMIQDGYDGIIVDRNNPSTLANAINLLHADIEMRKTMAENGYQKAKMLFDDSNILKIQNIYDALLENQ